MILVWAYFIFLPLRTFVPVILLLPILSLGIRRMHDIGKSGWWFGGVVAINFLVLPLILIGVYYLSTNSMDDDTWHGVVKVINTILNIFSIVFPTWLCCKPTKIKELLSSSDVMN
ncbi:DUF805 domain-containing protein [Yersinia kristensenii]|uniref:DUF805 domain-containing protein n=1 Tax=Yersinia kristensenii TaxID=28152 RepID=UPI001C60AAC7|nr:DUF805 domain-containing protein [Yersinia kristensenii]MBW5827609.1 DUF805 domain-containing protein [Yersinia kristensenii]